jgi:hypothetical protein
MGAAPGPAGTIAASTTVNGHGISVRLPTGWTGVVYQRVGGLPILHAGSFRLPPVDGDDGALRAVRRMRPSDVLLVMLEYRPSQTHFPNRALPLRLRRSEFGAPVEGMPWSHAFARIEFSTARRSFDLWIEFGSKHASPTAIRAADRVLATLRVRAR